MDRSTDHEHPTGGVMSRELADYEANLIDRYNEARADLVELVTDLAESEHPPERAAWERVRSLVGTMTTCAAALDSVTS